MKRDRSFQFKSTDLVDDDFMHIETETPSATQATLSPASSQAPQESAPHTPSLTSLASPPASNVPVIPPTPEDNPHELSQVIATMQPSPKNEKTTTPKNSAPIPSGENFLINSSTPAASVAVPQQLPVEPMEPSTPTPSIVLPAVAGTVLAHEIQTQANSSNPPIHQLQNPLSQSTSSLPLPTVNPLTDQARLSITKALIAMRPAQTGATIATTPAPVVPAPMPAHGPMRLSTNSLPRQKSDLMIQIAPVSPFKKAVEKNNDDAPATNCCAPIFCCGKQIFSGNMPACSCPANGCVIL